MPTQNENIDAWKQDIMRACIDTFRWRESSSPRAPLSVVGFFRRFRQFEYADEALFSKVKPKAVYEKIRLFIKGERETSQVLLTSLKYFLVQEGVLSDERLLDSDRFRSEVVALHSVVGDKSEKAKERVSHLAGTFSVVKPYNLAIETIRLIISPEEGKSFCSVEEIFTRDMTRANRDTISNDGSLVKTRKRRGFGFILANARMLHIYLRGATTFDRVLYYEPMETIESNDEFLLLRMSERKELREAGKGSMDIGKLLYIFSKPGESGG